MINTATVTGGGDVDDANNSATDAGGAVAQADLSISKFSDQDVVPARGEVTFTLEAVNRGPSTATDVQVSDLLAPDFEAIEVSSDRGSCTDAVVCTIGALTPGRRAIHHHPRSRARRRCGVDRDQRRDDHRRRRQRHPSADNNSAEIDVEVPASSDLRVDKSFAPTPNPSAGDLVTYTVTVSNDGPSTATDVLSGDVLPEEFYVAGEVPTATYTGGGSCEWLPTPRIVRCTIAELDPGQTETITITARLRPDSRGKTVLNSIVAISDSVDPDPGLATDTVSSCRSPPRTSS